METLMLKEYGITDARANLSEILDQVIHQTQPVVINRRRQKAVLIEENMMEWLLSNYKIKATMYREDDGSATVSLDPINIVAGGKTPEKAIADAITDLKVYAEEYFRRQALFLNAPNRRGHFPFVLRILLAKSDAEIGNMLDISYAEI